MIQELNERSREILRILVDEFVRTGEPVGSRKIAKQMPTALSPASVRNVMSDLEEAGLIRAPHTSAGRQPTERGLRLFVNAILQIGDLTEEERSAVEAACEDVGRDYEDLFQSATALLSGFSHHAGVVVAPKKNETLHNVEFVALESMRALIILEHANGMVENRIIDLPPDVTSASLIRAGNYLSKRLRGRTLTSAAEEIRNELAARQAELDTVSSKVVEAGLATWTHDVSGNERATLIVHGMANLLQDVRVMDDLERIRDLLDKLDEAEYMMKLLELAQDAEGVGIFIGADSELFSLSGCSTIVAPLSDGTQRLVGALGVIGPTHMNYARIIPMVDYTARVVSRLLG